MANYNESGDMSRLEWTLKDGATPMKRIYSTIKHLGSTMSFRDAQAMVDDLVKSGKLTKEQHPVNQDDFFYRLAVGGNEKA